MAYLPRLLGALGASAFCIHSAVQMGIFGTTLLRINFVQGEESSILQKDAEIHDLTPVVRRIKGKVLSIAVNSNPLYYSYEIRYMTNNQVANIYFNSIKPFTILINEKLTTLENNLWVNSA